MNQENQEDQKEANPFILIELDDKTNKYVMKTNIKNISEIKNILYHFYDYSNTDLIIKQVVNALTSQAKEIAEQVKKQSSPIVNPFTNKSFKKGK